MAFNPPPIPALGHRLDFSDNDPAESFVLSAIAKKNKGRLLAVVTADAAYAERLLEEIPWFAPDVRVSLLPDWETLPYDHFSPHQDLVSGRLSTLWEATQNTLDILIVPASTALYRLPPAAFLSAFTFFFSVGEKLAIDKLRLQLTQAAYSHVTQVVSPGEYAIRGSLIDIFPMGSALPYRIDRFDDEIESIKTFDVDSQRTLYPVKAVRLLPAREFPLDEAGRSTFRQHFRAHFEGDPARSGIYKEVSLGHAPAGVEYYLPLFFDSTATIFDYLPTNHLLVSVGDVSAAMTAFDAEVRSRYNLLQGDKARPLLPPEMLFLSSESFFSLAKPSPRLHFPAKQKTLPDVAIDRRARDPLAKIRVLSESAVKENTRIFLLAESAGRQDTIEKLFAEHHLFPETVVNFSDFIASNKTFALGIAPLHQGFSLDDPSGGRCFFLTENELYAGTPRRASRKKTKAASFDTWFKDLTEVKIGDPVVHEEHGIGRYQGLVRMDVGLGEQEFLEIRYANDAKLYVPVANLHVISRYAGAESDAAPLHTLGSGRWEKVRQRAAEQARDTAAELLALYAARAAREGYRFDFSEQEYERFADGFGFEETPDQTTAIAAVLDDMRSGKPMDRLVCGDVGFGKTEVALRAAFCAVAAGKQVAVLCPTTLLCEQHYQTFSDRFAKTGSDWPIKIAELSRFNSGKESAVVLEEMATGKNDIIIGTHKLIGKDIQFKRLGLVIVDEEHRFGVRQKERLKALRAEVDVLTLTATPIPRTLAMSMEGLRDFSVIATPPQKRLAIKTFVSNFSDGILREAILRELKRGGQVYFLHNEVSTIVNMQEKLEKLVPEATIVIGHGQMHERDLEKTMRDFTAQRANVLLCTTIIETGIDNPHANTILINRAEKFGLAQLHQLRGRVGRSHHQAYAYLLVQDEKSLAKQARQRLEAIQMSEELGSGFFLAMHDLEIRGAGEVLGDNQSGDMQEIGFNLYNEMLFRAIAALKSGATPDVSDLTQSLQGNVDINLHRPALLPDSYCPDVHERLTLYKRLANSEEDDDIDALREELVDRFGPLPAQAEALIASQRLRILLKALAVQKIDVSCDGIALQFAPEFHKTSKINPTQIIHLIQTDRRYKLAGQDKLSFHAHHPNLSDQIIAVKNLLETLQQAPNLSQNQATQQKHTRKH